MDDLACKGQFRELLPFYVNGTLDETQNAYIEEYLAGHADARAELRFTERMMQGARLHGENRDPMDGFALLKMRMEASRPVRRGRMAAWLGAWSRHPHGWGSMPASAVMVVFLAVQLTVMGALFLPVQEHAATRGIAVAPASHQQEQIKLTLKPGAAFGKVVALLSRHRCNIVWGPTAAGELWLALDFCARLRAGATALVYYAGHGIQIAGSNYLLPVDITPTSEAGVAQRAFSLAQQWLRKAARLDFPVAQTQLAEMMIAGQADGDANEALRLLRRAAQARYPRARIDLTQLEMRREPTPEAARQLLDTIIESTGATMRQYSPTPTPAPFK